VPPGTLQSALPGTLQSAPEHLSEATTFAAKLD